MAKIVNTVVNASSEGRRPFQCIGYTDGNILPTRAERRERRHLIQEKGRWSNEEFCHARTIKWTCGALLIHGKKGCLEWNRWNCGVWLLTLHC